MRASLRYPWPSRADGRPLCIAHRGASAHAREATPLAYEFAADLGANMWEVDIWLTADGVPVVCHDPVVQGADGLLEVAQTPLAQLQASCPDLPTLAQTVCRAIALGQALYLDIKAPNAGSACMAVLAEVEFTAAALGAFDDAEARALIAAACPWPVTVLVRLGEDPFARAQATGADIIHLCWEHGGPRPQDLVTPELQAQAQQQGLGIVLWHEERAEVLADLVRLPVLGICTDNPEMLGGFHAMPVEERGIEVVCHRGINHIAPENTLESALLTYRMGCDWLELDVRLTADGQIVVIHDETLDRTTNLSGRVGDHTLDLIRQADAGSWKSPHWAGAKVPTLAEAIALCQQHGKRMYIENKDVPTQILLDAVIAQDFLRDCFFWSGNPMLQLEMRQLSTDANIKSNIVHHGSFDAMVATMAPQICEIDLERWADEAPLCRANGIVPMLKYFGSDVDVFAMIAKMRPEMINLDRADLLLAALKA
ncbi:glycerophosphoryl diester phosphodiesterase [Monaibacterium marinum]|uniref:Glycerophosphoryl diester phosphodiesterase n=1 Tax=Pontivivens marinum TaxID=1690039 RepID=A0A2C9CRA3_9RHOB|nr:glycerophosphodiester phosphodiesterase family protein [Monaibacterium marinum]SOH92909.1 glycerophosphoryl diester phosphodiesterase [Monaibacterium marinum]